jgi:hypothetical protein
MDFLCRKVFLGFLFLLASAGVSYADYYPPPPLTKPASNPLDNRPKPKPVKAPDTDDDNVSKQIEQMLAREEVVLRKIKDAHVREERREHRRQTQETYKQALELYRQKRMARAKEAFNQVEDLMPDYKSTVTLLKITDKKSVQQYEQKLRLIKQLQNAPLTSELEKKASVLYDKTALLAKAKAAEPVKDKLDKLKLSFQQVSDQMLVQQQLAQLASQADQMDDEVFKLTQAKDYAAAKKKFDEFQETILEELAKLQKAPTAPKQ